MLRSIIKPFYRPDNKPRQVDGQGGIPKVSQTPLKLSTN